MTPPVPDRLVFDEVVIDLAGRRLLRAGREQPLEPKAFAVLSLLAAAPGRAFTRDQILDEVWGHHHVTPGVLNRIMTLLRQALGEDAQRPRLLHTVHGVGYRFEPSADAGLGGAPVAESPVVPAAAAEIAPTASPVPVRRRPGRVGLAGLAAATLAALLWVGLRPSSPPPPASAAADSTEAAVEPSLVVMPLRSIGDDGSARVIADGLGEELICSLARIDGLRVIAHASTLQAAAESGDAARLAQRLGITHTLEGNLQQSGQALRVRMRLVDAGDGSTVWVKDFDREASEVLGLQRDVAEEVASSLALKMGLAGVSDIRSGDADFLRRYMAARALLEREDLPPDEAIALAEAEFRALADERPQDARARAGLALALMIASWHRPASAAALRSEALGEAMAARRADPVMTETWAVEAEVAYSENDWARCLALKAKAFEMAPSNSHVSFGYVSSLVDLGHLDRAEAIARERLRRDPLNASSHLVLGSILDARGQHEEARAELAKAAARGAQARWFNALWRGDFAEALRVAEDEIAAPGHSRAPGFAAAARAGDDPGGWAAVRTELERFEREGGSWHLARLVLPDASADAARAIRQLDEGRQRGNAAMGLLLGAKELAWLRRDPAFQDHLRRHGILDHWQRYGFPVQCRAVADGAWCD